jgi:hypothetical protein
VKPASRFSAPAVEGQAVLPHRHVQVPLAELVGRHVVLRDDGDIGVLVQQDPVDPVEQWATLRGDRVDVLLHGLVDLRHGGLVPGRHRHPKR